MSSQPLLLSTFGLLILALCAVPFKPVHAPARIALPPWAVLFAASIACGLISGVLDPLALPSLVLFCGAAYLAGEAGAPSPRRLVFDIATALLALALAMHRLPGFHNPIAISGLSLSSASAPFTLYANYDKGVVGLVLLAFIFRRATNWAEFRATLVKAAPLGLATIAIVIGASVAAGYVKPDFKLVPASALFLTINLFLTVVAEEAFFRGFLQQRLATALTRFRWGSTAAVLVSALLFGAVHAAGGPTYILLASLAGLGYALAYHLTRRIEAPILLHFCLNAVHFIFFTYPFAQ